MSKNPLEILKEAIDLYIPNLWDKSLDLSRGDYLIREGEVEQNIYYIEEGAVHAYLLGDGDEQSIRFGYSGSFITSLSSFITGLPSEYYLQAIKRSKVQTIKKAAYIEFINSSDVLKDLWHKMMEQLTVQQMEREIDLLTASPLERYNRVLKRSPALFQEIPHRYIASYLRMTPETLSRLKKS